MSELFRLARDPMFEADDADLSLAFLVDTDRLVPMEPAKAKIVDIIWLAMDDPMRDAEEVADKVFAALGIGDDDD